MPAMLPDAIATVAGGAPPQAPHVVLVPFPAQGHVAPLMQLASFLLGRGARVTFVYTQYNHHHLVRAKGEAAVRPATAPPEFRVEVIDDGIPASTPLQDLPGLVRCMELNCPDSFRALLRRLGQEAEEQGTPPVTCVLADMAMPFAPKVAREAGIPEMQFFTASACGFVGYLQCGDLIKRGLLPLKGTPTDTWTPRLMTDDVYLDTPLPWVPGMSHMRLRDIPTLCCSTNPNDPIVSYIVLQMECAVGSKGIIINTLYELEKDVMDALAATISPRLYAMGPLAEVIASAGNYAGLGAMDISIWQEDQECLTWLNGKAPGSVVYVNFGSVTVMTPAQVRELALGLARSGSPFLWAKRPDVQVGGEEVVLPEAFQDVVASGGGLVVPWCPQAAVLKHTAVGLFVSHCGWNSLLEAIAAGQPVLGWPYIAEQTTNCRQVCESWGNGTELPREMESGAVAGLVREMMSGDLGKEKRAKAAEWKAVTEAAVIKGGASWGDLDRFMEDLILDAGSK